LLPPNGNWKRLSWRLTWPLDTRFAWSVGAFEVVASVDGRELASRFALNVPLIGGPPDRREAVLRSLLKDKAKVLRFLLFLLASDVETVEGDLDFLGSGVSAGGMALSGFEEVPLLESLVRSFDRDIAKLDAVANLVTDLSRSHETKSLLPDGFLEVWEAVWAARQELTK
jgi:hypothetical protein